MTIVLTSDHAGYDLKQALAEHLHEAGHTTIVVGAPTDQAYDYPDAADEAVPFILSKQAQYGVFICGTGTGICIRANRHHGVRGAPCTSVELARLAREHNDANVLCLGARTTAPPLAVEILEAFLTTEASHEARHKRRVALLDGNV
jgi:2-polyprenyl-6-hydroxyphenyl methylase/3-demethylubiquinone-9 3-methyltransferase